MGKRQCVGFDKFYGCLTTLFPSDGGNGVLGGDGPGNGDGVWPVGFTKNAVALLRETLNAFLQSVGEELAEVDSPSISPEDVVRAIGSIDCGGDSPEGSNPTGGAGALVLEEIVSRARDLLVLQAEQQRREEGEKAADCDGNVRPPGGPRTDAGAAPGKKTRKRKPKRPRITAEMEAEQERLLKASKRALDEAQGGGRDAFRVELS